MNVNSSVFYSTMMVACRKALILDFVLRIDVEYIPMLQLFDCSHFLNVSSRRGEQRILLLLTSTSIEQ